MTGLVSFTPAISTLRSGVDSLRVFFFAIVPISQVLSLQRRDRLLYFLLAYVVEDVDFAQFGGQDESRPPRDSLLIVLHDPPNRVGVKILPVHREGQRLQDGG